HEEVDAAEAFERLPDDFVLVGGVIGLAGYAERLGGAAELRDGLVQCIFVASGDDHRGAVGDEALRDTEADASAGPRDDCGASSEPSAHESRSRTMAMPWPP